MRWVGDEGRWQHYCKCSRVKLPRPNRFATKLTSAESDLLYIGSMKLLQFVGLIASVALFVSCETTQPTGMGNQEQKRLAAIQSEQAEGAQMDESERNLWNAQQDQMNTGSNPMIPFAVAQ